MQINRITYNATIAIAQIVLDIISFHLHVKVIAILNAYRLRLLNNSKTGYNRSPKFKTTIESHDSQQVI